MVDIVSDPEQLLGRFGLSSFRPGQREVIDAISGGRDVLCVMPTGGGKSLCYQLPSLARGGTTIVVSPLIALMKDQIDTLRGHGINARLINSSLTAGEQESVMREMAGGTIPMVYVAPERLRNGRFLEAVATANVTLLAVDEAHCVSEWGHDFRPDYARLGHFRERYLGNVQTIALTATATPTVRDDISSLLGLNSPATFVTGFARTNLRFRAEHCGTDRAKDQQLVDYLRGQPGSGIIYAATRKRCEELAEGVSGKAKRSIGVYHAGMPPDDRRRVQEAFMGGELTAIVATNAFGMGIDKSDIRFVVHYNIPGSLEAYYQEAGRAGRDGEMSDCLLLFSYQDRYIQEYFIENRYPSRDTVRKVYEYLMSRPEDPIELTLDQVREAIGIKEGSESVGTSETLLARAGVLKRLDSNANQAIVRIDSDAPTMLDFLPREAKRRRQVMVAVEKLVGKRRGEDVFVRPDRLAEMAGLERDQLARVLRELQRLKSFDYVPPFRGRAVHFIERDVPFDDLKIDFDELERRKAAEYQKLEAVIGFARSAGCRQRVILDYFGDPNSGDCGNCDRCDTAAGTLPAGVSVAGVSVAGVRRGDEATAGSPVDSDDLLRGLQIVLSGVARMHGRFGKNLVAQMLCGSKNKKLQHWKLHRLSTYGLLSPLSQSHVTAVIDAAVECGLIEQREVDERRPTVQLTELGKRVMKASEGVPSSLRLPFPLAKRLAAAARSIDPGGSADPSGSNADPGGRGNDPGGSTGGSSDTPGGSNDTPGGGNDTPGGGNDELGSTDQSGRGKPRQETGGGGGADPGHPNPGHPDPGHPDPGHTGPGSTGPSSTGPGSTGPGSTGPGHLSGAAGSSAPDGSPALSQELKERLVRFRRKRSAALDLPAYRILTNATIDRIAAARPSTIGQLEAIAGIGPAAVEQFGYDLVQLVVETTAGKMTGQEPLSREAYWTWRLFRDGYSADQIQEIRGTDQRSLASDLNAAAAAGHAVDPSWIAPSELHPLRQPPAGP